MLLPLMVLSTMQKIGLKCKACAWRWKERGRERERENNEKENGARGSLSIISQVTAQISMEFISVMDGERRTANQSSPHPPSLAHKGDWAERTG